MLNLADRLAMDWPRDAWRDVTVLVGVSGGADSVALLMALAQMAKADPQPGPGRLIAAHLNHRLRGAESDQDAAFVADLCTKLDIPLIAAAAEPGVLASFVGDGLEAAARDARYAFFERAAAQAGARYLALAHTADDQIETILHRILRGTGLAGLAGIPRTRPLTPATTIIRPLLAVSREAVLAYLAAIGQPFRDDATNTDQRFTRNRIRHTLLPLIREQFGPQSAESISRLGALAAEAQQVIDCDVDALLDASVRELPGGEVQVELAPLAGTPRYLRSELAIALWRRQSWPRQQMGYPQWLQLAAMLGGESTPEKQTLPGEIHVEVRNGRLVLRKGGS